MRGSFTAVLATAILVGDPEELAGVGEQGLSAVNGLGAVITLREAKPLKLGLSQPAVPFRRSYKETSY